MFTDSHTVVGSITVQDSVVATAWNISDWAWMTLTEDARRDYRDRVVFAPNFNTEGN